MQRREILAILGAVGVSPLLGLAGPGPVRPREPWGRFRDGPHYAPFVDAIRRLKASPDPASADSWAFWAGIHPAHCPHRQPYFLAWHRLYLWLFERKLRELTGIDALRLPYWDYYADPAVPAELRAGNAATNPLWEERRGVSAGAALAWGAFDPALVRFERGQAPSFEAAIESAPHNNIHNLIGGKMASMQSSQDILFWMHHANVDRLWSAWLAAGAGRAMPPADATYWNGRFDYTSELSADRHQALSCEALGYSFTDLALPRPPAVPPAPPPRVGAAPGGARPSRAAPNAAPQQGGGLLLGGGSTTVTLSVPTPANASPPRVGAAPGGARPTRVPPPPPPPPEDLTVVLDHVTLTVDGIGGGYFYKLYMELPGFPATDREALLLGTIGPFQIATAMHAMEHGGHGDGVRLTLPATELVRRIAGAGDAGQISVSFVRVDSEGAPDGPVIAIGAFRIERGDQD